MAIEESPKIAYYKLIVQDSNNKKYFTKYIDLKRITLGRKKAHSKNHVCLTGNKISRIHAKIFFSEHKKKFFIKCFSKNGLYVGGNLISHAHIPVKLDSASLVQISGILIYVMFPSIKRDFSKISFDLLNSLNRFKDPFVNLTDSEPSISIDSLVSASQGSKEIVYKIQNLNVKLNEKMIKLSIEALKTIGFFKWQKILEFLNSKNENIVINDESLKYCKILALLVINEICKKAFNSGDFDLSSKLAFILRTETNKKLLLSNIVNEKILSDLSKFVDFDDITANEIVILYHLNKFMKTGKLTDIKNYQKNPQLSVQNDCDLLKGVKTHKTEHFEAILNDKTLSLQTASRNDKNINKNMLKERFSNLLAIIINFNKINNKTGFEEKEWSVLEHYYFLHALASFGMPSDKNWSDFEKSFPNLFRNKTANSVQKRIKLLKEEIEICLKSDKNEIKDFKNGDLSNKKIVKLTQKGALNLKRRFDFFKLLRDKIKTLNISSLNFEWREQPPVWWDSPKMDLDLLKGCLKYGVGNWVKLKGDKNYQFSNSPQISFRHIQKLLLNRFMSLGQFIISGKNNLSSNPIKNNYKNNFSFFLNNQSPKIASKMQTLTNQNSLLKIQKTPNNKTQIPFNFNNGNNKKENFLLKPNKIFKSIDIRPVPQNNSMITPSLLLQSIGNIEFLRSNFHNNSYIFPIGYKTVRKYISFVDPTKNCKYVNEILDGKSCPIFSVTCEHAPNSPIQQIHPTSAWKLVNSKIKLANPNKTVLVPIDGLERFGLNEPKIRSLIDRLPNVSKCKQYGSQFKVGSFGYPFNLNPVSNVGNNSRSKMLHKKNNVPPPPKNF